MSKYPELSPFSLAFADAYRGFMKEHRITGLMLTEKLGRALGYVSERVNGKRSLDTEDVDALAALVGNGWSGRALMIELARRARVAGEPTTPNLAIVSGMTDDELSNLDLSQGDIALAATHDTSTVNEQSHPNYEDESQDKEDQ